MGAGYTTGKWEFDVQGRWQSSFTDYMGNEISASPVVVSNYVTFNARIGYSVTKYLTLAGTAEQFNDARIIEFRRRLRRSAIYRQRQREILI